MAAPRCATGQHQEHLQGKDGKLFWGSCYCNTTQCVSWRLQASRCNLCTKGCSSLPEGTRLGRANFEDLPALQNVCRVPSSYPRPCHRHSMHSKVMIQTPCAIPCGEFAGHVSYCPYSFINTRDIQILHTGQILYTYIYTHTYTQNCYICICMCIYICICISFYQSMSSIIWALLSSRSSRSTLRKPSACFPPSSLGGGQGGLAAKLMSVEVRAFQLQEKWGEPKLG